MIIEASAHMVALANLASAAVPEWGDMSTPLRVINVNPVTFFLSFFLGAASML